MLYTQRGDGDRRHARTHSDAKLNRQNSEVVLNIHVNILFGCWAFAYDALHFAQLLQDTALPDVMPNRRNDRISIELKQKLG